jgi:hypothetical protein
MTKDKDIKRRIRARMEKTGESYTTARSHLLRSKALPLPENYEKLTGKSDDVMASRTGRTWPEWVAVLDKVGAMEMAHRDIARWVHAETGLDWWTQTITVGYERIRGLRDVGQRRGGTYEANKTRTFDIPAERLFAAFVDAERRRAWLDVDLTIRRATPHKALRITWSDDTDVVVGFTSKGPSKTAVAIQHGKLSSKAHAEAVKEEWAAHLDALGAVLA